MIDLSTVPEELITERGKYATVRAAHEDAMHTLRLQCSQLSSYATQVLRKLQPNDTSADNLPQVEVLLEAAQQILTEMVKTAEMVDSLSKQREELRAVAWPKK